MDAHGATRCALILTNFTIAKYAELHGLLYHAELALVVRLQIDKRLPAPLPCLHEGRGALAVREIGAFAATIARDQVQTNGTAMTYI